MDEKRVELLRFLSLHNDLGFLLPVAIVLLFIVSGVLLFIGTSYISQANIYDMLESHYLSATIKKMETQR